MADTQVAPDQQQAPDTLPADFFQTKGTATSAPDTLPADFKFKETPEEKPQPSVMHNVGEYGKGLAHSVGLPESMQEAEEGTKAATEVTPMNAIRAVGGPAVSAGEQVYNAGKGYLKGLWNTGKEAYEAGQNIAKGGPVLQNIAKPASEYLNTNVGAVPFIGQPTVEAGKDIAAGTKDIVGMTPRAAGELTGAIGQVALPEVLDRVHPEQTMDFHNKAVETAQKKLDTAKKAALPYADSVDKGVQPPAKIQKPIDKAQTELNEAIYHRDTHRDAMDARRTHVTNPKAPAAAPEVPTEQIEAMPRPGAPKPAAAPENVKVPGQVQPEVVPQPLLEQPRTPIGRMQLPDEQGTMGKPRQLTAGANPPTGSSNLEDVVKATEEKEKPGMPQMRLPEEAPKSGMPQMTDEAALRALEAKEGKVVTNPKKLVGEQLKEALKPGEAAKPVAEKAPAVAEKPAEPPVAKAEEKPVLPKEEPTGYTPKAEEVVKAGEEGRTPAKSAAEYHPAVQQKVNELSDEKLRTLAKAHGLNPDEYDFNARDEGRHRTERDRLAREVTEQMGDDEKINLGRAAEKADKEGLFQGADTSSKGRAARAEKMFPRLRGPVDEHGNPKIGGGSQAATATAKEKYAGEERRTAERKAPLNSKETEEAIKSRKPFTNPFDETEGASKTIAKDKNMPVHPAEEAKAVTKADNYHGEPMSYEHHPMGEEGSNQQHHVTTKDTNGRKIGELVAQDTKSGVATVRSNQIYDKELQGKGRGVDQITHFLNNVGKDIHTVHSDISTSDQARGAWDKLEKAYPESVTKKTYKDGQTRYTVDMEKYQEELKK